LPPGAITLIDREADGKGLAVKAAAARPSADVTDADVHAADAALAAASVTRPRAFRAVPSF
jgi:hypothetical protein